MDHPRSEFAEALEALLYAQSRRGVSARQLAIRIAQAEGRWPRPGGRARNDDSERRNRIRRWERCLSDWRRGKSLPASPEILTLVLAEIASPQERQRLSALWWAAKAAPTPGPPPRAPGTRASGVSNPDPRSSEAPAIAGQVLLDHRNVDSGPIGPGNPSSLALSAAQPRVVSAPSWERWFVAAAVLAVAWVGLVLMAEHGVIRAGGWTAALGGFLVIVAGGSLAARGRPPTPDSARAGWAAEDLASATAIGWRRQAQGWGIDRDVIPVRWQRDEKADGEALRPPIAGHGPLPLPDGPPRHGGVLSREGAVDSLYIDVYLRLPRGRLVIVGARGSGKTAAMALLLLAALRHREALATTSATRAGAVPVPLWLSLASWDPRNTSLFDWARDVLEREYPFLGDRTVYGRAVADRLLTQGRIALFLDGLDEMPAPLRGVALDRIDRATTVRFVLTSRLDEYQEAVRHGHLRDTVIVQLCAVDAGVVRDFLQRGHTAGRAQQWAEIADHLVAHPEGALAHALDRPLMISLARDAYTWRADAPRRGTGPLTLVDDPGLRTAETVRSHLIEQLFVRAFPHEPHRWHAVRWLSWLTRSIGGSPDILWWDIPRRVRGARTFTSVLLGLLTMAISALGVSVVYGLGLRLEHQPVMARVTAGLWAGIQQGLPAGAAVALLTGLTRGRLSGVALGLGVGVASEIGYALARGKSLVLPAAGQDDVRVVLGLVLGMSLLFGLVGFFLGGLRVWHEHGPKGLRIRGPRRRGWRRELTLGSSVGGAAGCAMGWLLITPYHQSNSMELAVTAIFTVTGLLVGAAGTALLSTWVRPMADTHAALLVDRSHIDDRRSAMGVAVAVGTVITALAVLVLGTIFCPLHGLRHGLATSCSFGLVAGVVAGVAIGLGSHHSTYLRGAELLLFLQRQGRIRFIELLANAHAEHILRRSGVALQFRHEDIRRHLEERHGKTGLRTRER